MSTIIIQGLKSPLLITQGYSAGAPTVAKRRAHATIRRTGRATATVRRT